MGEMIFEANLQELMKEGLEKGRNMNELLPTMHFQVTVFGTVVPKLLGKMWIQGAYCLIVEQDILMDTGLTMSVC